MVGCIGMSLPAFPQNVVLLGVQKEKERKEANMQVLVYLIGVAPPGCAPRLESTVDAGSVRPIPSLLLIH